MENISDEVRAMRRTERDVLASMTFEVTDPGLFALPNQEPLERRTVADQVAQRIIALVKSGNLRAGDKLPSEAELAAAFNISRPSVREGLKMLRILGVTESRQGGRYYITDLSITRLIKPLHFIVLLQEYDADAHLAARTAVDLALVRLACERATPAVVQKLQTLAKAGHKFTTDPVGFRLLDFEFHQTINESASSPILARISLSLYELGFEFRRIATEAPGVIKTSVADHDLIVKAMAARKPDLAEKAFRSHLDHVRETTLHAQSIVENRRRHFEGKGLPQLQAEPLPRARRSKSRRVTRT